MTQVVTAPAIRARKASGEPLVMVTAYDAPGARIADGAGVDMILVGDSLAGDPIAAAWRSASHGHRDERAI